MYSSSSDDEAEGQLGDDEELEEDPEHAIPLGEVNYYKQLKYLMFTF